jgi:hypothetical protein
MITDKQEAISEIIKPNINFNLIDKTLLLDRDVAIAYMQQHSSNNMLIQGFPINIDHEGMVDDMDFILELIQNLDIGYDRKSLNSLMKYSSSCIIRSKISAEDSQNVDELKQMVRDILTTYNEKLKTKTDELRQKQTVLDEVDDYINSVKIDKLGTISQTEHQAYKRCDIGFTAQF